MYHFKSFVSRVLGPEPAIETDDFDLPRQLRAFDNLAIAPWGDPALVACMAAGRLDDLTGSQVKVYLLLLDTAKPKGLTASWIAEHLEMSASAVRSCFSVLKRKGSVQHKLCERQAGSGKSASNESAIRVTTAASPRCSTISLPCFAKLRSPHHGRLGFRGVLFLALMSTRGINPDWSGKPFGLRENSL